MRAQWVCSRERRIALYKRSSIINQSICPRTAKHKHSPKNKNLSQMAKCCFSYCAPKQWNSLPSDISHMQSPHAFKTALNIHLYKNSTTCDFRFYLLPFLPSFPSLLPYYNLHSFCVSVCASVCVCVCVCVCIQVWCASNTIWLHIILGFYVYIFVALVKHDVLTLVSEIGTIDISIIITIYIPSVRLCAPLCVCVCANNTIWLHIILGFYVYIFVALVKHDVLTLVSEIGTIDMSIIIMIKTPFSCT